MTSPASPACVAGDQGIAARRRGADPRAAWIALLLGLAVAIRWAATSAPSPTASSWAPRSGRSSPSAPCSPAGARRRWEAGGWPPGRRSGSPGGRRSWRWQLATRWPGPWLPFDPAPAFVPWAAVTILVATAEEVVLRGALFRALADGAGWIAALLGTSILFAVLHVPLYGWHVVPLDLGVGLFLGGLRLLTGGTVAPAVAHAVADLATWWI